MVVLDGCSYTVNPPGRRVVPGVRLKILAITDQKCPVAAVALENHSQDDFEYGWLLQPLVLKEVRHPFRWKTLPLNLFCGTGRELRSLHPGETVNFSVPLYANIPLDEQLTIRLALFDTQGRGAAYSPSFKLRVSRSSVVCTVTATSPDAHIEPVTTEHTLLRMGVR